MAGKPKGKGKQENAQAKERKKESARQSGSQAGKELLLLWAILGEGGGKAVSRAALDKKGMLPSNDAQVRDGLEARGLVRKVDPPRNEQGRTAPGIWLAVTEAGLAWAEENLAAAPAKSQAASPILQAWLARVSVLLQARKMSITAFLAPHGGGADAEPGFSPGADSPVLVLHEVSPAVTYVPGPSPVKGDYNALRVRIRQAYLDLTGGRFNTRALLRDLRQKLRDIDRPVLDEALKKMQDDEAATLYQLDNRVELTDADRAAAIHFGGQPRHILWIER
jgi:hypothetical protein